MRASVSSASLVSSERMAMMSPFSTQSFFLTVYSTKLAFCVSQRASKVMG